MTKKEILSRPRGTRDFNQREMALRRVVEGIFREVFETYGFGEIMTPTFERAELFIRKSGEHVLEEMYFFKDKSGRKLVLRPELTLPTMRFYYSELKMLQKPVKVYYIGNVFRYEEPQKGRYREFWQIGCEIIEGDERRTLIEGLDIVREILERLGILEMCDIRLGNISIVRKVLKLIGIHEDKTIIRALDKDDLETLRKKTTSEQLTIIEMLIRSDTKGLKSKLPEIARDIEEYENILKELTDLDIPVKPDLGIARGWDYYESYVFEVDAPWLGAEKQICGGGFYDLSDVFEEERITTFGFAFGLDRLIDALKDVGKIPEIPKRKTVYVVSMSDRAFNIAVKITRNIRKHKITCNLDTRKRNMRRALEYALENSYDIMIILGDKELEKGVASVKDLRRNKQVEVPIDGVEKHIIRFLRGELDADNDCN
ncbi:MAG: histidine--tRNA ligase [Thermoplasmata archaeon]|nr:histidine--tRNA ligase [Euryarchaeota archaeon]RLF65782.1 MAG: histidine--tRNA ligase [Thermoplasmata archaeon]